ncbi:amino acid permease [Peptostreptococcus russellii]|uniref:Serine/threonine exchange transporter, LAT family n=1 Tax=Peptostreptococcus russellii TaxID=215200 RepID=A0A1H8JFZ4_9FIRM|nr:amino acid permease [Peptostreptococcus russellii]MBC2578119.1 amino acid permease [Peptostreptococcus russellii]SEN79108.1 serine/threonine exchange transporter, LAT family [Peptostreptococcus russellii]
MQDNKLEKNIGLFAALSTVVGGVIGSGVFFKPQIIFTASGGAPGLGIIGWIAAGIITIAAGLTMAELASMIPETGGMMMYIKKVYGEKIGFLAGWAQVVLFFPGLIAALAVVFADQFVALSGAAYLKIPMAIGVIILLALLNLIGSKSGGIIQNVSTICKVAVLIILIVAGFVMGKGNNGIITPVIGKGINPVTTFGSILLAIFFAFDGWINVCALAGEMKDPGKDLPKAIVGGLAIVASIYVIINISYLWVVPASQLAASAAPASDVATVMFGPIGGKLIGVGIMISVFGACNAYIMTGSRVLYALSKDGTLPKSDTLSKINKNNVPGNAIIALAILSCIFALSGQFNLLTDFAVFSIWIFIVLSFIGVIILRKRMPDVERKYKVPLYPVVPIVAIASGLFVLINLLFTNTLLAVGGIVITLIGLPVYAIGKKKLLKSNKSLESN